MELAAVLVADRDKAFRVAVSALVTHAGMTARTAATGVEALASARSDHPSVVVLDVGLREISGYATCRGLREMFGEALPILFVSSERTEPSDRVAGLLLGADDYLAKPIDSDELLARIRRSATRSVAHARGAHAWRVRAPERHGAPRPSHASPQACVCGALLQSARGLAC